MWYSSLVSELGSIEFTLGSKTGGFYFENICKRVFRKLFRDNSYT